MTFPSVSCVNILNQGSKQDMQTNIFQAKARV